jgi:16S rRNA (uracil1498-N3)-methyltransferase
VAGIRLPAGADPQAGAGPGTTSAAPPATIGGMPRLFVTREQLGGGDLLVIDGDQAQHLAGPLRLRAGATIQVVDDAGREHGVRLVSVEPGRVTGSIVWSRVAAGEPRLRLEVVHALIREMDDVVAALSEVGAVAVRPFEAVRSVTRPDAGRAAARLRRWQTIACEGAQLAHRAAVPAVHPVTSLENALGGLPAGARILACAVGAATALAGLDIDPARPLALVVGPEGGLDVAEAGVLIRAGAETVHLGPRVLPARRAALVAAGIVLAATGDLDSAMPAAP